MNTTETTITNPPVNPPKPLFTYRIYQFANALGEHVWCVKRKGFLGLFHWMGHGGGFQDFHRHERYSRERIIEIIQKDAEERRKKLSDAVRSKLSSRLTLIAIEENIQA